jgi:hypothetical protein
MVGTACGQYNVLCGQYVGQSQHLVICGQDILVELLPTSSRLVYIFKKGSRESITIT